MIYDDENDEQRTENTIKNYFHDRERVKIFEVK